MRIGGKIRNPSEYPGGCETCKNNTLKKLKHGEIVKPVFKYIIDNRYIIDES